MLINYFYSLFFLAYQCGLKKCYYPYFSLKSFFRRAYTEMVMAKPPEFSLAKKDRSKEMHA